jgi:hypothetical protein
LEKRDKDLESAVIQTLAANPIGGASLEEDFFRYEDHFRPVLRSLVTNDLVGWRAVSLLCLIGDAGDVKYALQKQLLLPKKRDHIWRRAIAGALSDAKDSESWGFLKDCVTENYAGGSFVAAVEALAINGTPTALELLRNASDNESLSRGDRTLAKSVADRFSTQVRDKTQQKDLIKSLHEAANRLFSVKGAMAYSIGNIILNRRFDRALAIVAFQGANYEETYWLSFQLEGEKWLLKSTRSRTIATEYSK